nr:hypothetical protein 7 [Micrococcaceae bacterium]
MATKKVKNEYIIKGDIVELLIYDKNDSPKHIVLFSKQHLEIVDRYSWSTFQSRKRYYTHAHVGKGKYLKMHRLIVELLYGISGKTVDHINKNGLDNRDENLRYADNSQQGHNKGMFNHNTSGVKGVNLNKKNGRWRSEIDYKKKRLYKSFVDFEDAVNQRKFWENLIENNLMEDYMEDWNK